MSLLGKILIVLNVFAGLGTLALLGMNYTKRQNWEYAVFRQDLMISGLPLDDKETDKLQQVIVSKMGEKTKQDLFKQASPNTPVTTQEAEVNRVKVQLEGQFKGVGDKKKQIVALAHILTPMADTIEQRQAMIAYQKYLGDEKSFGALQQRLKDADATAGQRVKGDRPKPYEEAFHDALAATFTDPLTPLSEAFLTVKKAHANATVEQALEQVLDNLLTQLQGRFEQIFRNALSGGEGVQAGAKSQQKHTIARLLFCMVEVMTPAQPGQGGSEKPDLANNPAYKRFFIVVGVKAALEAVNEQAGILRELALETEAQRPGERGLFVLEHRKAVELARDKKAEIEQHKQLLEIKKKEQDAHAETLRKRGQDVKQYQDELAAERRQTARHLEQLRTLSDALFAERLKLRDSTQSLQELEHDIRALEQKR